MQIWKIVIWVFIGTIAAALLLELVIPANRDRPTLSRELLLQSQAMQIGLTGETGSGWHAAIADANSGDAAELMQKTEDAVFAGNYNAACAAAELVQSASLRDRLYALIAHSAVEQCASLPYAIFAVNNMQVGDAQEQLYDRVEIRQDLCRSLGQKQGR